MNRERLTKAKVSEAQDSRTRWAYRFMGLWVHGPISLSAHKLISLFCVLCPIFWIAVSEAKIVEEILVIVNDDIITKTELEERLSKSKELMQQLQYDEAKISAEIEKARPEILQQMINELLFIQEAIKKGIRVSDADIQMEISRLKGRYSSEEAFEKALDAEGYTLDSLKKEIKRDLLFKELIKQRFGSELRFTDEEVRRFYKESIEDQSPDRAGKLKLKNIFIRFHITEADEEKAFRRAEDILRNCRAGADFGEMATKFSDHTLTKQSGGDMGYFTPGMGKHDLRLEEVASQLTVGEISDLIESPGGYDIIKVTDIRDNEVKAQRIHIAVWPDPASEKAAEEKINSILQELKNGADFVALVKKYSDDPVSKDKDGDWKEIRIDEMRPALREAFDSFDEGEVSRPVRTPLGLHIFEIVERQDALDLTYEEMEQIREFLRQKRLGEKLSEYSQKLKEKAYIERLAEHKIGP